MHKKLTSQEQKVKMMAAALYNTSGRQYREIQNAKKKNNTPDIPTGTLYMVVNRKWVDKGTYCRSCNTNLGFDQYLIDNHKYICKSINNNEEPTRGRGRPRKNVE